MENESQGAGEQAQKNDDESVEEFQQEMEQDPSRAKSGDEDDDVERLRGG